MPYTLSEHESKRLLVEVGISVPEELLVDSVDAAVNAAAQLGMPVVLKLCGRGIAHKTERGLVRLDLRDTASVSTAARELLAARTAEEQDARLLVARMRRGRRELIAGLVRDPQFGPCVMLGLGGIFAEALRDVAFAVAPLERGDAEDLIGALQHTSLLGPFRGEPAIDRARLCAVLEGLARLGLARPDVRSVDINPLLVDGSEPVVVDALVELEGAP